MHCCVPTKAGRVNLTFFARAAGLVSALLLVTAARADSVLWTAPSIDSWFYSNGFNAGVRDRAPSFSGISIDEETDQFIPNGQQGPARLASMLVAFETSGEIEARLPPARYAINSVTFTARVESGSVGSLLYSNNPITPEGLLADALGGGIDPEMPIELFGVGFRDGYEGFALGPDQTGTRYTEATSNYSATDGGYVAYPVATDEFGALVDVSNNITGGFSATEPGAQTAPFSATPWAIGAVDGLQQGDAIANDTTFNFEVDLTQPGVLEYVQNSLADGALGFFVSSMHPAAQPGAGGGSSYPQWYTKESVGVWPNGEAPTLAIDFEIIDAFPPGDYDRNGTVDQADYLEWRSAYGGAVQAAGDGADGNGDGVVDSADYTFWRDSMTDEASIAADATPEPTAAVCLVLGIGLTLGFARRGARL